MARKLTEYIIKVRSESDFDTLIPELQSWNIQVLYTYRKVFFGLCVMMTGLLAKWYKDDPRILSIEESGTFYHFARQLNAPPHLDRLDQRTQPLSGTFTYSLTGNNVIAYILDSGGTFQGKNNSGELRGFEHIEFEGRLSPIPDPIDPNKAFDPFFDGLSDNIQKNNPRGFDGLGHGTHVAGIIGSKSYGVAKNITMRTSKIFGSSGVTTSGIIIAGIDAILTDHINSGSPLAVCNMSFGGVISVGSPITALETAVLSLINNGIVVVVAAGNSGKNAEGTSPARIPEVITVGAVDQNDEMANFSNFQNSENIVAPDEVGFIDSILSNFGSVVDIFAIGVNVLSTWKDTSEAINTLSGTSMAAPGVTGVVALFIENSPGSTPATIKSDIITNATVNEITLTSNAISAGTPNRLIYSTFVDFTIEWITPPGSLGFFAEGSSQTIELEASGFSGNNIIYSVQSGSLPLGLILDGNTGIISGILPTVTTDTLFSFTIRASDASSLSTIFSDRNFSITVLDANLPPQWITATNLGEIEEGQNFQIQFSAESRNGIPSNNLIYSSVGGVLPFGWQISSSGLLEGQAPININKDLQTGFKLRVDDGLSISEKNFSIIIKQRLDFLPPTEPKWITPAGNIGSVVNGNFFSFTLEAIDEDNNPQPLSYHLQINTDGSQIGPVGVLPPGLSLDTAIGKISGTLTGITTDEIFEFAVYVTDGANIVGRLFSINALASAINQPPEWITPSGNLGVFNSLEPINIQLNAFDPDSGPDPIKYLIIAGQLPPGITLNETTGLISGIPSIVNNNTDFIFTVKIFDGIDSVSRTFAITINRVNIGPEWITSEGLIATVNEGELFNFILEAVDQNNDELRYKLINGSLPPNLTLIENGVITGRIDNVSNDTIFTFTIEVDDSKSNPPLKVLSAQRIFSIKVIDGALNLNKGPQWITSSGFLTDAIENQQYFEQIEAIDPDNGPNNLIYFLSAGSLPPGLALNQSSGIISGIPIFDSNITDDIFNFTVKAFDGLDFAENSFKIKVIDSGDSNLAPIWQTPAGNLGSFDESIPLLISLSAIDPENDIITYTKTAGILPPGLILNSSTGTISGTPAQVINNTNFGFTIRAEDSKGKFSDRFFSIEILNTINVPPLWITPAGSLGTINENQPITFILNAIDPDVGPNPTLNFSLTSGSLPPGLSLDSSTGIISGTPDPVLSDTTFNFEITVDDGLAFIPQLFSITIKDIPIFTGNTSDLVVPLLGEIRNNWRSWNTDSLIPDTDIFQLGNPIFGRKDEPNIFIAKNLHTDDPNIIFNSFGKHHSKFTALLTIPDFAVVRDSFGNIIYEVIYLKIFDPQANSDFDILSAPIPSILDTNGIEEYISKNFFHLRDEILTNIPNDDELPQWMTSEQILGDSNSKIGYIPAIEMAFVKPGKGKNILNRLNEITQTITTITPSPTTFDGGTTTFDATSTTFDNVSKTIITTNKGQGFQFTGTQYIIDRYQYKDNNGNTGYIKFNSDNPNPIWITTPGLLGSFNNNLFSSVSVLAESPILSNITYSIVFGNLPDGMSLNVNTGEISGIINVSGVSLTTFDGDTTTLDGDTTIFDLAGRAIDFPFVIRATDNLNNFTEQAFIIKVT